MRAGKEGGRSSKPAGPPIAERAGWQVGAQQRQLPWAQSVPSQFEQVPTVVQPVCTEMPPAALEMRSASRMRRVSRLRCSLFFITVRASRRLTRHRPSFARLNQVPTSVWGRQPVLQLLISEST
jgi:hypothetical protein